jgi:hypothetical protein
LIEAEHAHHHFRQIRVFFNKGFSRGVVDRNAGFMHRTEQPRFFDLLPALSPNKVAVLW